MAIPRAKKPKKKMYTEGELLKRIEYTNYLNISIMVRYFYTCKGFRQKRLEEMMEGYLSLMDEIADGRATVLDEIDSCKALTGIDIKKFVDKVFSSYSRKKRLLK